MLPELVENAPDLLVESDELRSALDRVERCFDEALRSDLPPLQRLVDHLERYRGKMLRPALVILCGRACGAGVGGAAASVSDAHVTIAAVCEMIHMATLVHDDVLDEADVRRKGATVNRLRGNETAVILGDYLFSSAYRLCSTLESQRAALLIGACGMTLCAGELLQLHHRENLSLDEPTYYEIVRRKTGSLIAVACRLGALQAGSDESAAERLGEVGMSLGVAFQIQDDLLDLTGNQDQLGKPVRRDLELGKLTLPLIHHLRHAGAGERTRTLELLSAADRGELETLAGLASALGATGSIDYARGVSAGLVGRAKTGLMTLAESPARALLLVMADQVIARTA